MITVYPYEKLGHADHGWLDARHHFSFAHYWDPARMGFGVLRVINDDRIAAGQGFETHRHENMEIITYVRQGAITHKDNMNNTGRTATGDVQIMSAGTGVYHSEHNLKKRIRVFIRYGLSRTSVMLYHGGKPRPFPKDLQRVPVPVLVSGQQQHAGKGALFYPSGCRNLRRQACQRHKS